MKQIQTKKIFITYENIPNKVSNEFFLKNLKKNIKIDNYIICHDIICEERKKIFIFIENEKQLRNLYKSFNIKIDGNFYTYNKIITKINQKKQLIDDLLLKKNVINTFQTIVNNEFLSTPKFLSEKAKKVTSKEIEKILIEDFTDYYSKRGESYKKTLKNISDHYNPEDLEIVEPKYTTSQFNISKKMKMKKENWNPKTHAVVWYGKSGSGKTSYLLADLKEQGRKVCFLTSLEDFALVDPKLHDTLFFDDVDFFDPKHKLTKEGVISIVDVEHPRTQRYLYNARRLPAGMWKIFATNNNPLFPFENYEEVSRRLYKIKVEDYLFKKAGNINIQINNIQINNIQQKDIKENGNYNEIIDIKKKK